MGGQNRRIVCCALCGQMRSHSTSVLAVLLWCIFVADKQRHCSTALADDSEAVARNERLADKLPSFTFAMDKQNIAPGFDFYN
mgnify:CR=1 FL=1